MSSEAEIRIEYISWGNGQKGRLWCAINTDTGEAIDYHTKGHLIYEAKKAGLSYEVIRHHRDGTKSIMERG